MTSAQICPPQMSPAPPPTPTADPMQRPGFVTKTVFAIFSEDEVAKLWLLLKWLPRTAFDVAVNETTNVVTFKTKS